MGERLRKRDRITGILKEKILLLDGSYGAQFMREYLKEFSAPDVLNLQEPKLVERIHRSYVDAGSDIIMTNTFGSTPYKLSLSGIEDHEKVIREGVRIAKRASKEDTLIMGNIGSTGKMTYPVGDGFFDFYYENYRETARIMVDEGVDGIILETFSDILELKAAVLAVRNISEDIFLIAQMTFDEYGKTLTGTDPRNFAVTFNDLDVDAIGINCSLGPEGMVPLVGEISRYTDKLVSVEPNAGIPVLKEGKTEFPVGPEEFSTYMEPLWENGANIIGGCCGTGPDHIRLMRTTIGKRTPIAIEKEEYFTATCPGKFVDFDRFVVVGEKLNPSNRKSLQNAMKEEDLDVIIEQAKEQVKAGADVLDLNFGLEGSVSLEFMEKTILSIAYSLNVPISLDIQTFDILERMLRIYPGRPIINSSTAAEEELEKKLSLIEELGGILIVLSMGKKLPKNSEDRINNIENVLEILSSREIETSRILFDPIVLSLGAGSDPNQTLKTIEYIHNKDLKSIYGLSNLSFGMPNRALLHSAYLSMSIERGLDSAIMNPEDESIMDLLEASLTIMGKAEVKRSDIEDLDEITGMLIEGKKQELLELIKKRSQSIDFMSLIEDEMKPAMERVGELYSRGDIYLPQLILAAQTSKPSFSYIESNMKSHKGKDKLVIATVKGDIHDIGKNIVSSILRSSGYDVIDLGKDVPSELIVESVKKERPKALGLSAMMTTTAPRIKEISDLLKKRGINIEILAGGACLDEEVVKELGADHYTKDALSAIKILKRK